MNPPDDFCAFILSHGRADRVITMRTLENAGYTGPVFIVCDDEDTQLNDYRRRYGESVLVFSKSEAAKITDKGDNFFGNRGVVFARNAVFDVAEKAGFRYFIVLDDDYTSFGFRMNHEYKCGWWRIRDMNDALTHLLDFFKTTPFHSIALAQGGDLIGGCQTTMLKAIKSRRKVMNSFICSTDRRFSFFGRINEDVNMYVELGRRGLLFLTICYIQLTQKQTQANAGGLTEIYLDAGTYVKSFYSVMYTPSAVKVAKLHDHNGDERGAGSAGGRIHHAVNWNACAPKILRESVKR